MEMIGEMTGSAQARSLDDRRSPRTAVRLPATLESDSASGIPITVVDLSAHGIMARTDAPLLPGRPVALSIPGLERHAGRIVWARDERAGIAFDHPLTPEQFLAVLVLERWRFT